MPATRRRVNRRRQWFGQMRAWRNSGKSTVQPPALVVVASLEKIP
jgi:hypothetical protein